MPSADALRYMRTQPYRTRRRRELVSRIAFLAMALAGFVLAGVIALH